MNKAPILSPSFKYHGSATHSDPRNFHERMQRYREKANATKDSRPLRAVAGKGR